MQGDANKLQKQTEFPFKPRWNRYIEKLNDHKEEPHK